MKQLPIFFLISVLGLVAISCKRNDAIIRQLHYVDLLNPGNSNFVKYPNEFSTYILKGVLAEQLQVYHIDYDSSGIIDNMKLESFITNILDPYLYDQVNDEEEYEPDENYRNENASSLLSSITLLSFDNLLSDGMQVSQYINFYHPAELTPEGLNRYIGSVKFDQAMDYLNEANPQFIWNNFTVKEWGWYKDKVFIPEITTCTNLAVDLIKLSDSASLAVRISESLDVSEVKSMAENSPLFLNARINTSGEGNVDVIYKNDSITLQIGIFTFQDLVTVSNQKKKTDSVKIIPVTTAIYEQRLQNHGIREISNNGSYEKPLKGEDELSKKSPDQSTVQNRTFPSSQKFYFRTQERLIGDTFNDLDILPELLYDGVKNGSITVYNNDSLNKRMLPGQFFDNMIIDLENNIFADISSLMIYMVITETVFEQSGKIIHQKPVGIGVFLPGSYVPEGFNRPVGYFRIDHIDEYLETIGHDPVTLSGLHGYPLSSWNIQVYPEELAQ